MFNNIYVASCVTCAILHTSQHRDLRKGYTMNKLIIAAFISASYVFAFTDYANAQTTSYYGGNGQYSGSSTRNGNTTSYYGANGQYQGNSISNGNTTSYYGGNGQYQGYTTRGGLR